MQRKIYLEDIPLDEAWAVFRQALTPAGLWQPLPSETIPLAEAPGRCCPSTPASPYPPGPTPSS